VPAKASYSESELATYMVAVLDSVATDLGLTASSPSVLAAVTSVERLLGVSDVATLTDMAVLESAATWRAWGAAYGTAVTKADEIKAGSAGLKWGDRLDGLKAQVEIAEGAYWTAVAASEVANGTGPSFFAFATVCGRRGR
jgi:hypothetical protein